MANHYEFQCSFAAKMARARKIATEAINRSRDIEISVQLDVENHASIAAEADCVAVIEPDGPTAIQA
jgi:hypothetical protein